jgi:GTP pyrophosphokinase
LNEVTQVISRQLNVNIRKLTIETEDGIFEGKIQLWVHDVDDVKTICNNLKKIQNIKQVSRVEDSFQTVNKKTMNGESVAVSCKLFTVHFVMRILGYRIHYRLAFIPVHPIRV